MAHQHTAADSVEYYYRYEERRYATLDEFERCSGHTIRLSCFRLAVTKRTPKGVWVDDCGQRRFVLNDAKRRFAHPTKREALESFLARKKRHQEILESQLRDVGSAIALGESAQRKLQTEEGA